MSSSADPQVSVCVPAFNAEQWIEGAVRSALAQTHPNLEVVVVDNASTDNTVERVREIDDPRVRLYANSRNLGVARNFNRSASRARAPYVKFLCADDVLYPDCVERMLRVFESDSRVGLVFSPRDIELEDRTDPVAVGWKARHELAHTRFGELDEVTSGDALLAAWIDDQLATNWIGEPTSVMISRACLRQVGGFHVHMRDRADMDLWARAMLFYAVGFVNRPLSRFRVRSGSLSSVNRETGQSWLDRLWFLEGLMTYEEVRRRYPYVSRLRTKAILRSARYALRGIRAPNEGKLRDVGRYLDFRLRGRCDRSRLYGAIDDSSAPGETVEVKGATGAFETPAGTPRASSA